MDDQHRTNGNHVANYDHVFKVGELFVNIDGDHVEYRPGAFLDICRTANGGKPSKAIVQFDKLAGEITTRQEWEQIFDHMFWHEISRPDLDSTARRDLLSKLDTCPCCQQWLGHNNPPTDGNGETSLSYRRQTSFEFKK